MEVDPWELDTIVAAMCAHPDDAKVQQEGEKARSILATLDVGESKN